MKPTYRDKYLPTQSEHTSYFEGDAEQFITGLYALIAQHSTLKMPNEEFVVAQSDQFTMEEMGSNPILLRFLELLVALKQPKMVCEIGTFIGLATMYMARALPPGGIVVGVEKYDRFADIAEQNFKQNGLAGRIRLIRGDAFVELRKLDSKTRFDLVFLDGDKGRYADYFSLLDPFLASGGLLVVDDVFFHGDVLNPKPKTDKGVGAKLFLEKMERAKGYRKVLLPLGNGLALLLKD